MAAFTDTIIVTGGTSGIGYECALALAKQNPTSQIIICSRTDPNQAAASINSTLARGTVTYLPLDLNSKAAVRSFAADYSSKHYPPIRALLLNAGIQFTDAPTFTADGIERTFGINHVGHALLFHLLRPHLKPNARIVVTASGTHDPAQKTRIPDAYYNSAEELAHPIAGTRSDDGRQRYSTSKLVNVMWTYALARRLATQNDGKITVAAFDPGLVPATGLTRNAAAPIRFIVNYLMPMMMPVVRALIFRNTHLADESGQALASVATSQELTGKSGLYYELTREIPSSVDSHDEKKQEDLWKWTLDFIAEDAQEREKFERA